MNCNNMACLGANILKGFAGFQQTHHELGNNFYMPPTTGEWHQEDGRIIEIRHINDIQQALRQETIITKLFSVSLA